MQRRRHYFLTERLYYRDSFLREFDAQVISCESAQTEGAREGSVSLLVGYPAEQPRFIPHPGASRMTRGVWAMRRSWMCSSGKTERLCT